MTTTPAPITSGEALKKFLRCTYPVSPDIHVRGYNWCEAWLDEARTAALAATEQVQVPSVYWQGEQITTTGRLIEIVKEWAAKGYDQAQADALAQRAGAADKPVARTITGSIGDYTEFCSRLDMYGQSLTACESEGYHHGTIERRDAALTALVDYIDTCIAAPAAATADAAPDAPTEGGA